MPPRPPILLGQLREAVRVLPSAATFVRPEILIPVPMRRQIDPRATVGDHSAMGADQVRFERAEVTLSGRSQPVWRFAGPVIVEPDESADLVKLEARIRKELGARCVDLRVEDSRGSSVVVTVALADTTA